MINNNENIYDAIKILIFLNNARHNVTYWELIIYISLLNDGLLDNCKISNKTNIIKYLNENKVFSNSYFSSIIEQNIVNIMVHLSQLEVLGLIELHKEIIMTKEGYEAFKMLYVNKNKYLYEIQLNTDIELLSKYSKCITKYNLIEFLERTGVRYL